MSAESEERSMDDRLRGVFAPITTPFDGHGEVDYFKLEQNMET